MAREREVLVGLLLLVDRETTWTHVDKENESTNNGEGLEEIVSGVRDQ